AGLAHAYNKLKKVDPEAALRISAADKRRIIRALEVYETTKQPISVLQKKRHGLAEKYEFLIFGLRREREDLYKRIDQRVDFMVNAGLLDEVRSLLKKKLSRTAYMCIGIREIEGFLKGSYGLDEAIRLIKRNSRHFAKRQMTWFKKTPGIEWIDVKADQDMGEVAKRIYKEINH
ncbi:MAG TPA: tRNA (adenosine(37)-N6)-dimethylallyltransferase MiaA, partial [Candidatus Omnitrophota bacterium]|nr:tRNA (adenosine(37)-N6)-dimethylallyltransferase MiaA [Candidatus Omnitrophota bacterium]